MKKVMYQLIINPLHPNINMQVLHTYFNTFNTFSLVPTRRICLKITSEMGDHFLYSHTLHI